MTFHVGQQVECVDDAARAKYLPSGFAVPLSTNMHGLKRGVIYTIRGTCDVFGEPGVWLEEIVRGYEPLLECEMPFSQHRFRPLIERKTDIAFAHEILRKVTRKDRVSA